MTQTVQGEETNVGLQSWLPHPAAKQQHESLLPSFFLTNIRILTNKTQELQLEIYYNHLVRECCLLIATEFWLHLQILIPPGPQQILQ